MEFQYIDQMDSEVQESQSYLQPSIALSYFFICYRKMKKKWNSKGETCNTKYMLLLLINNNKLAATHIQCVLQDLYVNLSNHEKNQTKFEYLLQQHLYTYEINNNKI